MTRRSVVRPAGAAGRFMPVDPEMDLKKIMHVPQAWNRYAYVEENPMKYVDANGRGSDEVHRP